MTPYDKHTNHQIEIIEGPFDFKHTPNSIYGMLGSNSIAVSQPGKIMCKTCNIQIKWASKLEIESYNQVYKPGMTFKEYTKRTDDYIHSISEHDPANIFLVTTFKDKDIVKKYGATWDPYHKLWYTTVRRQGASNLTPWMMPDDIKKLKDYNDRQKTILRHSR